MSRLRETTWRDIPQLVELERELFAGDAWTAPTWWAELAGRPRRDYVVWEGDSVDGDTGSEGCVAAYGGIDHGGEVADIMTVAVAPAHRGQGLGDRLVEELLARAAGRGAGSVMLEVRADNTPARGLYARHGFREVSVRRRYYQPDDVDAIVMRRALDQVGGDVDG